MKKIGWLAFLSLGILILVFVENRLEQQRGNSSTLTQGLGLSLQGLFSPDTAEVKPQALSEIVSDQVVDEAQKEFAEFTQTVLSSLPTSQALQLNPQAALHQAPPALIEASLRLAQVKEMVSVNPNLREPGMLFYQSCASNGSLAISIRALCFKNAKEYYRQLRSQEWAYDSNLISAEVIALAEKL